VLGKNILKFRRYYHAHGRYEEQNSFNFRPDQFKTKDYQEIFFHVNKDLQLYNKALNFFRVNMGQVNDKNVTS
jgi:hypothetical protein